MDTLSVIWFSAAAVGTGLGLAGLLVQQRRQQLFLGSAGCFLICGVLGILSIGMLFLILAVALIAVAVRSDGPLSPAPTTATATTPTSTTDSL